MLQKIEHKSTGRKVAFSIFKGACKMLVKLTRERRRKTETRGKCYFANIDPFQFVLISNYDDDDDDEVTDKNPERSTNKTLSFIQKDFRQNINLLIKL